MTLRYKSEQWNESQDSNLFPVVTLGTAISGEDLVNNLLVTENRYSYGTLSSSTTLAIKNSAGFLHTVVVGSVSCPSTAFWDNTVPGTTLIGRLPAGAPVGSYLFDVSFVTGLTVDSVGGSAPTFTFSYR